MRAADLGTARVAVWGLGREGRAAIGLVRAHRPDQHLLLLDDAAGTQAPAGLDNMDCAFGGAAIAKALGRIDVLVKSPGVSLYRREIELARGNGVRITSLLNLWFAQQTGLKTVCVTGTKGKSTTASLIAHMLGPRAALAGNIGVPVTEIDPAAADWAVIEVSSYQAADFDGVCDIAVLTSLFPEHLDWHRSLDAYYRDKLNLLRHARHRIVNCEVQPAAALADRLFNDPGGLHARGRDIFDGGERIGPVRNRHLARPHNLSNLCAALAVVKALGRDPVAALGAAGDFRALPHRQQEIGTRGGVLYVDDSISTAPQSAIAALDVYAEYPVTAIVGGYDRGVDYGGLVARLTGSGGVRAVVCLGASGERVYDLLRAAGMSAPQTILASSMAQAVAAATRLTPRGGVVLLSPAAPSYGAYRDFAERGRDFAAEAGFAASSNEGDPE